MKREQDRRRGTARERGYSAAWSKARAGFLKSHPLCVACQEQGRLEPAVVVDHVIAHGIDRSVGEPTPAQSRLFWDAANWQPLCAACHDLKTRRLDGWAQLSELVRPNWLSPSAVPLTIVCGPPGAGKSRYIDRRAGVGDAVIDLDRIKAALSGLPLYHAGNEFMTPALRERNRQLAQLASTTQGCAWLALTAPLASDRRHWREMLRPVDVVVLAVDPGVCKERIGRDERRAGLVSEHVRWVDAWWKAYSLGFEERVILS